MPVAEAERRTRRRADILASAWPRARVVSTRLERRSCLRCGVQRPSAMEAPARLMTASAPTAAPPSSPVAGFQFTSKPWEFLIVCVEVLGRIRRQTVWPARWRSCVRAVPTRPVEPVIRIFMGSFFSGLIIAQKLRERGACFRFREEKSSRFFRESLQQKLRVVFEVEVLRTSLSDVLRMTTLRLGG